MTKSVHSPLVFAWFGLVLIASVGLYRTSDRVQHLDFQLRQLNASIEREQQRLHVLKAEWTYLSNPARLAEASRKHLAMRPTALQQITSLDQAASLIPERGSVAAVSASAQAPTSPSHKTPPSAKPVASAAKASVSTRPAHARVAAATATTPAPERKEAEASSQASTDKAADGLDAAPAKTASAQPLPDSINALLDRMEAHP